MSLPSDERIEECVLSISGLKFGAGNITKGSTNDFFELEAPEQQAAISRAIKWCQGLLSSMSIEEQQDEIAQEFDELIAKLETGEKLEEEDFEDLMSRVNL